MRSVVYLYRLLHLLTISTLLINFLTISHQFTDFSSFFLIFLLTRFEVVGVSLLHMICPWQSSVDNLPAGAEPVAAEPSPEYTP